MTQSLLPRSKPWSQFPHDPALGGQSRQCLDYILTQLNQLVFQGNVPPSASAYSFGPDIINPTGPQLISLGGRPSSVVTAITYNAVGTVITFYWDGTNSSQELTIYRDDNTIAGPTLVGSPFVVSGLAAATRYFFYPYWDDINKVVRFVSIPNVSVGTPPVAFPAYNIKAQQTQILRSNITLAAIVGTAGIITGSGVGSAGGSGGGGGSGVAPGRGPTGGSPGGVNGDIQFNNGGVFGGEAFVPLAHGGTGVDLSAAGSATAFLAENAAHLITARSIIAADVPNLDAGKITTGQLALARGGTNADLSATGGASQVLKQVGAGAAITVGQEAFTDIFGIATWPQMPLSNASGGIAFGAAVNGTKVTVAGNESALTPLAINRGDCVVVILNGASGQLAATILDNGSNSYSCALARVANNGNAAIYICLNARNAATGFKIVPANAVTYSFSAATYSGVKGLGATTTTTQAATNAGTVSLTPTTANSFMVAGFTFFANTADVSANVGNLRVHQASTAAITGIAIVDNTQAGLGAETCSVTATATPTWATIAIELIPN